MSNLAPDKTAIIIQARMGSTRLPGKVLRPFYKGKSILDILFDTLRKNSSGLPVVVATSVAESDGVICDWAKNNSVEVYRGDETNVLNRFVQCCQINGLSHVVRVCADNPFLDLTLLDQMISRANEVRPDYCSYMAGDHTPSMKSHLGIFAEWVTTEALKRAQSMTSDPLYTEHVTNFIYGHPDSFRVEWLKAPEVLYNRTDLRFTIDTPEDFSLMSELYGILAERAVPINFNTLFELVRHDDRAIQIMQQQIRRFTK